MSGSWIICEFRVETRLQRPENARFFGGKMTEIYCVLIGFLGTICYFQRKELDFFRKKINRQEKIIEDLMGKNLKMNHQLNKIYNGERILN